MNLDQINETLQAKLSEGLCIPRGEFAMEYVRSITQLQLDHIWGSPEQVSPLHILVLLTRRFPWVSGVIREWVAADNPIDPLTVESRADIKRFTPLFYAVLYAHRYSCADTIRLLVELGANINIICADNRTLFDVAVMDYIRDHNGIHNRDHIEIPLLLLELGVGFVSSVQLFARVLKLACVGPTVTLLREIFAGSRASLRGFTYCQYVSESVSDYLICVLKSTADPPTMEELVRFILQCYVRGEYNSDHFHRVLLYVSVYTTPIVLISIIIDYIGRVDPPLSSQTTYLHALWQSSDYDYAVAYAKLLIAAGADVNAPDASGRTPVHEIARSNNTDLMGVLVDSGAKLHGLDTYGRGAVHYAVFEGSREMVRFLLSRGADPMKSCISGLNAWHQLILGSHRAGASRDYVGVATELLSAGYEIDFGGQRVPHPLSLIFRCECATRCKPFVCNVQLLKLFMDCGVNIPTRSLLLNAAEYHDNLSVLLAVRVLADVLSDQLKQAAR